MADALIDYMLALPGNEDVESINPLVGETNDGYLNDIRGRHITRPYRTSADHVNQGRDIRGDLRNDLSGVVVADCYLGRQSRSTGSVSRSLFQKC